MFRRIALPVFSFVSLVLFSLSSRADEELTPHAIIDRALKAGGGTERIQHFKAVEFKAKLSWKDAECEVCGLFAGHSRFRLELKSKDLSAVVVGGGDTVWLKHAEDDVKEYHPSSQKDEFNFDRVLGLFYGMSLPDKLLALKGKGYELTLLGDHAVNGVEAIAMGVNHPLHPEAFLYFDKETGFPVKSQVKVPVQKEGIEYLVGKPSTATFEIFFDGYQQFSGVKHYTKVKVRGGEANFKCELRELKLLKEIDSDAFKKPK